MSLLVSVSSSILGIDKFQEKCFINRTICELLKREKYLYFIPADTCKNLKDNEKQFEQLVQHIEMILTKEEDNSSK